MAPQVVVHRRPVGRSFPSTHHVVQVLRVQRRGQRQYRIHVVRAAGARDVEALADQVLVEVVVEAVVAQGLCVAVAVEDEIVDVRSRLHVARDDRFGGTRADLRIRDAEDDRRGQDGANRGPVRETRQRGQGGLAAIEPHRPRQHGTVHQQQDGAVPIHPGPERAIVHLPPAHEEKDRDGQRRLAHVAVHGSSRQQQADRCAYDDQERIRQLLCGALAGIGREHREDRHRRKEERMERQSGHGFHVLIT